MPALSQDEALHERQDRLLTTLEHLLENSVHTSNDLLSQAVGHVQEVLGVDKVDVFSLDSANETLVANIQSDTPMGRRQRAIGMDRAPLANGGVTVEVFLSGISYLNNAVDRDPTELRGVKEGLGVKSKIASVFRVQTQHRGVIVAETSKPDFFSPHDLYFLEAVARWVGLVVARAELAQRMQQEAAKQEKGQHAEELLTLMAHDLRNYLTPLQGRLELIEARALHEDREKDRRDAESGLHTLQLLTRSISNVLDVARLNQGLFAIKPESMNLTKVIQQVAWTYHSEQVSIRIQSPSEIMLVADPERLQQALEHMLIYGISRAPNGVEIRVGVTVDTRKDGPWVVLTVHHNGLNVTQLFADVPQSIDTNTQFMRMGLGIYLTNQIALAHHGTLTIQALNDSELWFSLALPVEDEELTVRGDDVSYIV